ncbi:hypothetical protein Q5O14_14225 [Eubacteriaceae bacterium ES2]|nr:hypothetical protein Q5O14_14225 [Eubacteriaceae bacterium ES2]
MKIDHREYSMIKFYLSPSFMQAKTTFKNLEVFFQSFGYEVHSQENFDAIPADQLDLLIRNNTRFENFDAFMSAALDYSFESQLKQIKF